VACFAQPTGLLVPGDYRVSNRFRALFTSVIAMSMLQVASVSKSYGQVRAVQDVSLEVRAGEIYGLLGPNGAGKTTTISMISGLLRPDAGKVVVKGVDVWANPREAKSTIGVVPQDIALYEDLSAIENLRFWGQLAGLNRAEAKVRADELVKALALEGRARESIKSYSGVMKRRINIGCGLMHRPRLLLLDEPTVGIDPQARSNILEFVRGLCADGTAILYTTHYLEEAESLCQRIGIIDQGRLLAEGTLGELQERLGGDRVFLVEGNFIGADPGGWAGFTEKFRLIQKSDKQIAVAALGDADPADCLRELLQLPVRAQNVILKRPTLNDVFLQLTGRDLRE
jgi:ABC-2 type transport system ATP-binding protein